MLNFALTNLGSFELLIGSVRVAVLVASGELGASWVLLVGGLSSEVRESGLSLAIFSQP